MTTRLRPRLLWSALAALALVACAASAEKRAPEGWTSSFNDGLKRALAEKKPMVVDVYTDWCGVCKKMDADTFGNPAVQKALQSRFVAVKFNAEDEKASLTWKGTRYSHPQFTQKAGVEGYPTILFFDPAGEFITGLPGYADAPTFLNILDFIREGAYKTMDFAAYAKSKKS